MELKMKNGKALLIQLILVVVSLFTIASAHSASPYPFVAPDFHIPKELETKEFRLRMLTVNDVIKDYDAVMSSVEELQKVWESRWPKGLTLEEDLIDLGWHQREFLIRSSFAYTVISLDGSTVLGCVYVNPTRKKGYVAEVYLWARETPLGTGLDARLESEVKAWLKDKWAFKKVGYSGRDIDWDVWNRIEEEKR